MDVHPGLTKVFAQCFTDYRNPDLIEYSVEALLVQRTYGIAPSYEGLNDHTDLLRDPWLAMVLGKEDVEGRKRRRKPAFHCYQPTEGVRRASGTL